MNPFGSSVHIPMEYSKYTAAAAAMAVANSLSTSSTSTDHYPSSSPPPPPLVIQSPCGACKFLRRRCAKNCLLAPYFPPSDPLKFSVAHRVFGASNVIKWLQELPEAHRADAVNSMVYEANARVGDPIYGCTGTISHLQNQVSKLQAELAKARAEILNMQCQNANLLEQIQTQNNVEENLPLQTTLPYHENSASFYSDEENLGFSRGGLWP